MYNLALHLQETRPADTDGILHWLERAAHADHPLATLELACLLEKQGRHLAAADWFLRAARAGQPEAMFRLGYLAARRRPAGLDTARYWWQHAALIGSPLAATLMATH